jgi:hypothetical protein
LYRHPALSIQVFLLWIFITIVVVAVVPPQIGITQQTPSQRQYVFEVSVLDDGTNGSVEGARIYVKQLGRVAVHGTRAYMGARDSGVSRPDGTQYFRFQDSGEYAIIVEHPNFVSQEQVVSTISTEQDMKVIFRLERKSAKSVKLVNVLLVAEGDGQPVANARVFLQESLSVIYRGETDHDGKTLLSITEGKTFGVEIYHSQFKTFITTLRLTDDKKDYYLTRRMKRKTDSGEQKDVLEELKLRVGVFAKDAVGNFTVPVSGAQLSFPDGQRLLTDSSGRLELIHKFQPDEDITVDAEANGFISKSVTHKILRVDPEVRDIASDALSIQLEKPSKFNTLGWIGGWQADSGRTYYTFSGTDNQLSGVYSYDLPGVFHANARGNGQLSDCIVKARHENCANCDDEQIAECQWRGTHQDDSKPTAINSTGTATLTRVRESIEVAFYTVEKGEKKFTGAVHRLTKSKSPTRSEATQQLEEYNRQVRERKIAGPVAKLKGGAISAEQSAGGSSTTACNSFQEEESGWKSVWTRRGTSDVFDASFTGPSGQKGSTVNTVTVKGNTVQISRTSSTDGNLCTYEGTLQSDGTTVEGTYSCSMGGRRSWRATGVICKSGN